MTPASLQIIRDEHATLSAMLNALGMMLAQGPGRQRQPFFDVVRAMLFYIDEIPERLHHPKESALLFPAVAERDARTAELIERLEGEHERGEAAVRALQHQLLAWELLGESRRQPFEVALRRYLGFYLEHMRLEETVVLPAALKVLGADDWAAVDAAFATNTDPFNGKLPREPLYDELFTRIVSRAPAPIGLG